MLFFIRSFWPGIIWWLLVIFLTLSPGNYFPKVSGFWNLFSPDKVVHLFIFGVLAFLLLHGSLKFYSSSINRTKIQILLTIAITTGILTEILQALFPIGRESSIYDVVANIAGSFSGYYIFRIYKNKSGKKQHPNKIID